MEGFKKAYFEAERDVRHRESRFEEEKRALHSEIHQLRVRHIYYPHPTQSFNLPDPESMLAYENWSILIAPTPHSGNRGS